MSPKTSDRHREATFQKKIDQKNTRNVVCVQFSSWHCTVAYSRVNFKTLQYSISYPVRKRFKTVQNCFPHNFINELTKNDHSTPFSNRKIRKKIENCIKHRMNRAYPRSRQRQSVFNAFLGDFSNRKLGFLESPENFGHFWPLLTTPGHFWPLLTTSDRFWPLLATFGRFWPLLVTSGHFWPLLATFGHFWPLLATSGHFWPLLTTFFGV